MMFLCPENFSYANWFSGFIYLARILPDCSVLLDHELIEDKISNL